MHLLRVVIRNFRSLKKFSFDPKPGVNLIIGPNASGKTTVLEAIRLAKAVLAPRTQNESGQIFASLGLVSPNWPQGWNFKAIASDPALPVIINCDFLLSETEIRRLPELTSSLARSLLSAQLGFGAAESGLRLTQFLSTEAGRQVLSNKTDEVVRKLGELVTRGYCRLHLTINPDKQGFQGLEAFDQSVFMSLESDLSYRQALFSYFPADRGIPLQEPPIQLGVHDALQKAESHNSQPGLKYQRLKNDIFSAKIADDASSAELNESFKQIFTKLLRGRELRFIGVSQVGNASITVKDVESGNEFDIDALSSGEKGIITTFLLMSRSVANYGLVLFDEPELHLNPAVCKHLPDFMQDELLGPKNIQSLICSHSPEILASVLKKDDSAVFHLKANNIAEEIRKEDHAEVAQVLSRLGASAVDELIYDAVVYVEGDEDVEMLEDGFQDKFPRVKFSRLGGRAEVEKNIKELQSSEKEGKKEGISFFIFDQDRRPTDLVSTPLVRIGQWDRYSLENYLIDGDLLYDVFRREGWFKTDPQGRSEAKSWFSELATKQLSPLVMAEVYSAFDYENSGLRPKDLSEVDFEAGARKLFSRLKVIQGQLGSLEEQAWINQFVMKSKSLYSERSESWEGNWQKLCNGKLFFKELQRQTRMGSLDRVKRILIRDARIKQTEGFVLLNATLSTLLRPATNPLVTS